MNKIQTYKLSLKLRWIFAKDFIKEGLLLMFGWSEIEGHMTKKTRTVIMQKKIHFSVKKNTKVKKHYYCLRCGVQKKKGYYELGCKMYDKYHKKHLWYGG